MSTVAGAGPAAGAPATKTESEIMEEKLLAARKNVQEAEDLEKKALDDKTANKDTSKDADLEKLVTEATNKKEFAKQELASVEADKLAKEKAAAATATATATGSPPSGPSTPTILPTTSPLPIGNDVKIAPAVNGSYTINVQNMTYDQDGLHGDIIVNNYVYRYNGQGKMPESHGQQSSFGFFGGGALDPPVVEASTKQRSTRKTARTKKF